jgi:hypothetical protein
MVEQEAHPTACQTETWVRTHLHGLEVTLLEDLLNDVLVALLVGER